MKNIFGALIGVVGVALIAWPALTLAATYQYVDSRGDLRVVAAETPTQAIAVAPSRAQTSGVMFLSAANFTGTGGPVFGQAASGAEAYLYVDVGNNIRGTSAATPEAAMATAPNIHPNSGVILATVYANL